MRRAVRRALIVVAAALVLALPGCARLQETGAGFGAIFGVDSGDEAPGYLGLSEGYVAAMNSLATLRESGRLSERDVALVDAARVSVRQSLDRARCVDVRARRETSETPYLYRVEWEWCVGAGLGDIAGTAEVWLEDARVGLRSLRLIVAQGER